MKLFVLAAVMFFGVTFADAAAQRNIMSMEAKGILAKNSKIFLLDVRTPDEFRQARLKGAILIPINELQRRLGEIPRNRPIMVYCAVGSRSNVVAAFLSEKGYGEVYNVVDGIVGWYRNGYPIER